MIKPEDRLKFAQSLDEDTWKGVLKYHQVIDDMISIGEKYVETFAPYEICEAALIFVEITSKGQQYLINKRHKEPHVK